MVLVFSAKSEGRRTVWSRMGHDTSSKQHNISWWKTRRQMSIIQGVGENMMSYLLQRRLEIVRILVRPRVVVGKYISKYLI